MTAEGTINKWCTCKDTNGKRLNARCPGLRRSDGKWHTTHGTWIYQLELPRTRDNKRRQLRRSPAASNSRDAAVAERDHAKNLLMLAGDDTLLADEIATMLQAVPSGTPLPDRDTVARRVRAGIPANVSITVADYLTRWITERVMDDNTRSGYDGHIRNYLIPHLGKIRLDRLNVTHLDEMYAKIVARNVEIDAARTSPDRLVRASVKGKKPIGAATMTRIRATLRKALNDAIRKYRYIEFNPARHVELPTAEQAKARLWTDARVREWRKTGIVPYPVMVWTPDQAAAYLDYTEEHDPELYPLYAFVLRRGPRRGEAVGISRPQIDLDEASATITHQIATHKYRPIYKPVKTRTGDRVLALDSDTIDDFQTYNILRAHWEETAGPAWPRTVPVTTPVDGGGYKTIYVDLYFRQPDGSAWHPDTVSERFERNVRKADLPPVGIHDGRHGAATYAKAGGAKMEDIKEQLGHSTIAITADIYTSLLRELERATAENTANVLKRRRRVKQNV
ncbi:site-specific integrase [Catellatospora sp. TT07R-123]|uniref:tyrosine-type recombinase/integrase n=1 Tax=Catellatospora sp. TT07R-123 TaxID=2733863 RepID=UPI001B0E2CBD|nr:tyrosine-type recombinase/integrase [Catellatospora sp. TT07R-123]GHJ50615.1 site-specific integrase [Catellatospora sp. TT07R-123]